MKPKVIIDNEVYRKIMHWVNKSQYEVSGLGTVVVEADGTLRVTGAMLLPQKNGPTHTDIEADAVCKALYELRNSEGEVKFWWHSHVMMNVFWSGTDHAAMKDFAATPDSWMLATVFNQKNELKSAYYSPDGIVTPWGNHPLFYDELATTITDFQDVKAPEWDAEYEKNVVNVSNQVDRGKWWDVSQSTWKTGEVKASDSPRLTKKERKLLKRQTKLEVAKPEAVKVTFSVDEWGFDQDERKLLADVGYSAKHIENLFDYEFNAAQILLMAEASIDYDTVLYMMENMQFTQVEVMAQVREMLDKQDTLSTVYGDDVPVADRRHVIEYGDW